MAKVPYTKTFKSYAEQLTLLKNRGLAVESDEKALHLLEKLSYYRLSGYWYPLLADPKTDHTFKPGASFQTAFRLYRFDRDLRIFILKELEKIEVAIKAHMIYELSREHGAFWYTDANIFKDPHKHNKSLEILRAEFKRCEDDFIKNFRDKYSDPLPPSWIMLEIASFGTLSKLFDNLKSVGPVKKRIANIFGVDETTFASWLHSFVYIRNVCAHHSRLWNRVLHVKPKIPDKPKKTWLKDTAVNNDRIYFLLSVMMYLLQSVDSKHQFIFRLKILLRKYPNVDVTAMGFPDKWLDEPLWTFKPNTRQFARLCLTFKVK